MPVSDGVANRAMEYIMTQLYGKQGEQANQKELRQLHDMQTFCKFMTRNKRQ